MTKNNRKGVALLMVAIIIVIAVPLTLLLFNISVTQKDQAYTLDRVFAMEQTSLSGVNYGYSKLKNGYNRGYANYSGEISGQERFNLNMTPVGIGFFRQNIYLLLSNAKDKTDRHSSIIMADAEQFYNVGGNAKNLLVITHDYWHTQEPYEIGVMADVLSMKNERGKDQLRNLDVKRYEMEASENTYRKDIASLTERMSPALKNIWPSVMGVMIEEKIKAEESGDYSLHFYGPQG